ncbi:MAG: hypothetical protein LC732_10215 [Acidobacteria bacterium]|nr:hypothetical protein [Acidobacteriota bacterium]
MHDDQRRRECAPEDAETIGEQYEELLSEGMRAAEDYAMAPKSHRARLALRCDRFFAKRIALLRRTPDFPTLERRMPMLRAIGDRVRAHSCAADAAEVARVFDGADRRYGTTIRGATEGHPRNAGEELPQAQLDGDEAREFARIRVAVLDL